MREKILAMLQHAQTLWQLATAHDASYYDVDDFGRDLHVLEQTRPIVDFFYKDYWRVQTRGMRHVPAFGPGLIVANHSGSLPYDGSMIHMAIYNEHPQHRLTRLLVEDLVQYMPFVGTFLQRLGGVRACPENAQILLQRGELVTVFPEGVKGIGKLYAQRYQLARFGRGGIVRLAIKTRAPIIPCAVIGAEEIHPILWKAQPLAKLFGLPYIPITPTFPWLGPLGLIPLPSQWLIRFGKPIHYDQYTPQQADDRLLTHQLTEQLRQTIQKMVTQGLKEREKIVTCA